MTPIENLKMQLRANDFNISTSWQEKTSNGYIENWRLTRNRDYLFIMIYVYTGGEYELFLPAKTIKVQEDIKEIMERMTTR